MNTYQGKQFIRRVCIVLGCVVGFGALVAGLACLVDADQQSERKALCGTDGLAHTFYYDHRTHAVCFGNDGVLYLSERTK